MSHHDKQKRIRRRVRISPDGDEIGYGKPPKTHQFKPGQSGNPKGRPKGAKSEATILMALLNRKIEIRRDGKVRKITILEGILLRIAEDSLKGNTKSATFVLNRLTAIASTAAPETETNPDDKAVLDAYLQEFQATHREQKASR